MTPLIPPKERPDDTAAHAPGRPPVASPMVYGVGQDDPSLVIFRHRTNRRVRIEMDGDPPIVVEPRGVSKNVHLGLGEHGVRVIVEKPTAYHGVWEVVRFWTIVIRPEGGRQIFEIVEECERWPRWPDPAAGGRIIRVPRLC
jgi:hypothetical protein